MRSYPPLHASLHGKRTLEKINGLEHVDDVIQATKYLGRKERGDMVKQGNP